MPTEAPGQAVATSAAPNPEILTKLARAGVSGDVIQMIKMEVTRSHAGPLPTVETYEGYERVCPGAAREILDMAVRQQSHSHKMERYNAHSEFWLPVIGISCGFLPRIERPRKSGNWCPERDRPCYDRGSIPATKPA
jgi:hypothetical protein